MKTNKGFVVVAIIVILALGLAGFGAYKVLHKESAQGISEATKNKEVYYMTKEECEQKTGKVCSGPQMCDYNCPPNFVKGSYIPDNSLATSSDTSNWKTYHSQRLGLTFSYPDTWGQVDEKYSVAIRPTDKLHGKRVIILFSASSTPALVALSSDYRQYEGGVDPNLTPEIYYKGVPDYKTSPIFFSLDGVNAVTVVTTNSDAAFTPPLASVNVYADMTQGEYGALEIYYDPFNEKELHGEDGKIFINKLNSGDIDTDLKKQMDIFGKFLDTFRFDDKTNEVSVISSELIKNYHFKYFNDEYSNENHSYLNDFTLVNGKYPFEFFMGRVIDESELLIPNTKGEVVLSDINYVNLNNDGVMDAVAITRFNFGGSGWYTYLSGFLNVGGLPKYVGSVDLGDRPFIDSISENEFGDNELLIRFEPWGEAKQAIKLKLINNVLTEIKPSESDVSNWKTYKNEKYGFEFKYPLKFDKTEYASFQDEPEAMVIDKNDERINADGCYSGPNAAHKYSSTTINGTNFCLTSEGDVGAGQLYKDYYYSFNKGNVYIVLRYIVHTSNGCGVYDNGGDPNSADNARYRECQDFFAHYDDLVLKPIQDSVASLKFIK